MKFSPKLSTFNLVAMVTISVANHVSVWAQTSSAPESTGTTTPRPVIVDKDKLAADKAAIEKDKSNLKSDKAKLKEDEKKERPNEMKERQKKK
jgi:hypothetical protein